MVRFDGGIFCCPPTISDSVGDTFCYIQQQRNYWHILPIHMVLLPRFPSSPNPIRYSWRARGDSSLWPQGTVTELPSGTSPGPPKIQNPESKIPQSKIQNPNFFDRILGILDFGVWILDHYVAILYVRPPTPQILDFGGGFWILDFGFWILDVGFWILDFGFRILDFGFWILDFGFWILGFGFWILDFGFWISDFGFWILERYVAFLYVQILDFGFWVLDFGFRIWDLGFWISDFGFWVLDFGFWILDFGFWILDFGFWILDFGPNFGCYIPKGSD